MFKQPKIHSVKFSIPKDTEFKQIEAKVICKTIPDLAYLSINTNTVDFSISKDFVSSLIASNHCLVSARPAATLNQAEMENIRKILKSIRNKKGYYSFIKIKSGLNEQYPNIKPIRINYFTAKTSFDISIDFILSSDQDAFDSIAAIGSQNAQS